MKTPDAEKLTFRKGRFLLVGVSSEKLRRKLSETEIWKPEENDSYSTVDLAQAVRFRSLACPKVEKFFQKRLQEKYEGQFVKNVPGLDPHQMEGLRWALTRKRSYLAHAPGAGKTATAIFVSLRSRGTGQTLFIVPPSLTKNWEREIDKFAAWDGEWPDISTVGTSKDKDAVDWDAEFLIVPDSMLAKDWVQKELVRRKWKLIAVDEASRFKEPFAQRSLAFYGGRDAGFKKPFPGIYQNARHVVFLDGSPMPNRPIELWAPTYALDPESIDCRSYDDFGYRYCGAKPNERGVWEYKFSSNEAELKEKLQKSFMHVVTEDRLNNPERLRSIVTMNEDVRTAEHRKWERQNIGTISFDDSVEQGDLARFRRELGLRKVPWVTEYLRQRLDDKNESLLVFAWHRDVALLLFKAFAASSVNPGLVLGGTPSKDREKFFDEFQLGKRKLLILNIAAGGRGHNLQRADRVIFAEFAWTDETNRQCENRTARRGNDRASVRCEYIVCPGSMDEMVLGSAFTKERRVKRIIG